MSPKTNFEREIVTVLGNLCAQVRELSAQPGGLPRTEAKRLRRVDGYLSVATEPELDWGTLAVHLAETGELWEELTEVRSRAIESGELIVSDEPDPYPELGAHGLWDSIVRPLLKAYHAQRPDWEWDEALACRLLDQWSDSLAAVAGWCDTIAPLHNFDGPDTSIEVEDDLVIRPLSDADREALWLTFGNERAPNPLSPSVSDLASWTHAIEYRWRQPEDAPLLMDHGPAVETVREVVNAVRLQHPGVTGTTIVWTRPSPPPELAGSVEQALLSGSLALGSFKHSLAARLEPGDAKPLRKLLHGMRAARGDRSLALALRRFDSAYSRHEEEDSLIDLWIAFEALLLPDGRSELSYRASLRIAQLVAGNADERREAFQQARLSYRRRSEVVHGKRMGSDLHTVVNQTRELARRALRAWILNPPPKGVEEIDESLLA